AAGERIGGTHGRPCDVSRRRRTARNAARAVSPMRRQAGGGARAGRRGAWSRGGGLRRLAARGTRDRGGRGSSTMLAAAGAGAGMLRCCCSCWCGAPWPSSSSALRRGSPATPPVCHPSCDRTCGRVTWGEVLSGLLLRGGEASPDGSGDGMFACCAGLRTSLHATVDVCESSAPGTAGRGAGGAVAGWRRGGSVVGVARRFTAFFAFELEQRRRQPTES